MTLNIPRGALLGVLGAIVVAGVGVGAYFVGRSSVDTRRHYRTGYTAGYASGQANGYSSGRAAGYASGHASGLSQGEQKGEARGRRSGEASGRASGEEKGRSKGEEAGQAESFEGFHGGWEVGSWYLVKIGTGEEAGLHGKYSIGSRVGPMAIGTEYSLCNGGICTR